MMRSGIPRSVVEDDGGPMVNHSLHTGILDGLDPARLADGSAGCFGFWFRLRRRRTADGFTRFEGTITAPVEPTDGAHIFTVYLSDDERRAMAAALLEGLDRPEAMP